MVGRGRERSSKPKTMMFHIVNSMHDEQKDSLLNAWPG